MNIEDKLNFIKKDYQKIEPSLSFLQNGWKSLEMQLSAPGRVNWWGRIWSLRWMPVALAVFVVSFGIFGLYRAAHATVMGDRLYPLKRWSENVVIASTGNSQIKVDHRAQEIIQLAKENEKNQKAIEITIKEYQENINQTQQQNQQPEKKQEFEKKLEIHREEFKEVAKSDPEMEEKLKELTEDEHETKDNEDKPDTEETDD